MALWTHIQPTVTLLVILSILVVAHEWGHFIVARLCGIRVDDFSIGFGKRLFRICKRGDTEYNVRMLPLGGFVKIAGMEPDEAPLVAAKDKMLGKPNPADPDSKDLPLITENIGDGVPYTSPDGFYSKPLWQRALVILAGPVMSFLFGYLAFCLMGWTVGIPSGKVLSRIGMVSPGGEGQRIGLRTGDVITAINGQTISDGKQMIAAINGSLGKTLTLNVRRGDQSFTKTATPQTAMDNGKPVIRTDVVTPGTVGLALGLEAGDTVMGIGKDKVTGTEEALSFLRANAGKAVDVVVSRPSSDDPISLHAVLPAMLTAAALPALNSHPIGVLKIQPSSEIKHLSFRDSVVAGTNATLSIFAHLGEMVRQPSQIKENTGGIIFMYQVTNVAVKNGLVEEVAIMAQLSISLAIFNLLPIPILDGGHLLTFLLEWIRRGKRLTDQQQQAFLMTGLAIIGVLFVLINSHDIIRTITHQVPQ